MKNQNRLFKAAAGIIITANLVAICLPSAVNAVEILPKHGGELRNTAATESVVTKEDTTDSTKESSGELRIDNRNKYDGMSKTYAEGYIPQVTDGTVAIVLPLAFSDADTTRTLQVTFGLGDPDTSPFVFSNYDRTIECADCPVNNASGTVKAYLLTANLALKADRENGVYPLTLHIEWQTVGGAEKEKDILLYVTITDGNIPTPTAAPTSTPMPRNGPRILVSNAVITPETVKAGETFSAKIELTNASADVDIENVKIQISTDSDGLLLDSGGINQYISHISAGETKSIAIKGTAESDITEGIAHLVLGIDYNDDQTASYQATESISLRVSQPLRLQIDTPVVPDTVNAGDTFPITVNVMNAGLTKVYNVKAVLTGTGFIPEKSLYLGNLESGNAKSDEMYVFAGRIANTGDASKDYGLTQGVIRVEYEDSFGNVYSEDFPFSCTIQPIVVTGTPTITEKNPAKNTQTQWMISAILGGIVLLLLVAFFLIRGKKRANARRDEGDGT